MEGRQNREDERRRHKRKKGRRQDRGQTELKLPRHPAASVINNKPEVGLQGSPGRSRHGEIVNEGKLGKGVSGRERGLEDD
ncbi:hypothetical protein NQZ68_017877 [Dissostichus eleginoides]|nr:hypothetical protein NQZ68_017877 [Dissostichus eleginoides]